MNNKPNYTIPSKLKTELIREVMLNANQHMYDHGYLSYDMYRQAKERFLTLNLNMQGYIFAQKQPENPVFAKEGT